MKLERKRIFISELPETATQDEIEKLFNEYGNVISVEIKERKELGPKNDSLFFAYINIEINDSDLQKCFKEFANLEWHGQYVQLQLARESFLDRLKREREEKVSETLNNKELVNTTVKISPTQNGLKEIRPKTTKTPSKLTENSERTNKSHEIVSPKIKNITTVTSEANKLDKLDSPQIKKFTSTTTTEDSKNKSSTPLQLSDTEEVIDLVIKNNKNNSFGKNGLQIESVGNKPIITVSKPIKVKNDSEANLKRLQSLKEMKKGYQAQKSAIKAALSNVDFKSKSKIVFDDTNKTVTNDKSGKKGKNLFDEDEQDDEFIGNFDVKEQFEGQKGKELLELQSKYKNDKRFKLDERFLDEEGQEMEEAIEEESIEMEKKKELEILEQIIGKKIPSKMMDQKENQSKRKTMLRFDPSQPEHSNFEVKKPQSEKAAKKRKRNDSEMDTLQESGDPDQSDIVTEKPSVSKEVFYKVSDNLKNTFQEKQEFSLLSMFGNTDGDKEYNQDEEVDAGVMPKDMVPDSLKNPFKYDSSDDEDETDNIPHQNEGVLTQNTKSVPLNNTIKKSIVWSEPLFFKKDDYRLQDGFDFIERMKVNDKEFSKVRRNIKEIVKAKVRNNERKNKMFKHKLGGNSKSKRRKATRLKKALKR